MFCLFGLFCLFFYISYFFCKLIIIVLSFTYLIVDSYVYYVFFLAFACLLFMHSLVCFVFINSVSSSFFGLVVGEEEMA